MRLCGGANYLIFERGMGVNMEWSFAFFFHSSLLGIGLAMDAFSVSLANGLNEPMMKKRKMCMAAGIFALFQAAMPMIGWLCVHTILGHFRTFAKFIPWIALLLLSYIGIEMLLEGFHKKKEEEEKPKTGIVALLVQGIATSIDALSVGFTISEYGAGMASACAAIIAAITFVICMAGLFLGKKFGTRLSGTASIFGGVILIVIGLEIFLTS